MKKGILIGLYNLEDNELLMGLFTYKELAEMFETSTGVIHCAVCRLKNGEVKSFRRKYTLVKVR